MSWRIQCRVKLEEQLSDDAAMWLRRHNERWSSKLSEVCSGYALSPQAGELLLVGSTQPSGERRTVDDVMIIINALLEAEHHLKGTAVLENVFSDETIAVRSLNLGQFKKRLVARWGSVGLDDDDTTDELKASESSDASGPHEALADDDAAAEDALLAAREAFAEWKRQSCKTPQER